MTCDYLQLAMRGVQGLTPYQPGKPIDELERELGLSHIIKLASNENPQGPSVCVREAISAELGQLTRYPDGNGFQLKQALAKKYAVNTHAHQGAESCQYQVRQHLHRGWLERGKI